MTSVGSDRVGVLVVDDDRSLADLYEAHLGNEYRVDTAYSGPEALELLDETIDVVLLDRMMPSLSGGAVLEEIRASDVDCRVAIVSAVTPDLDIIKMEFDAYLRKPVDAAELRDTVERMLVRAEYDRQLQELFSLIERRDTLEAVKRPDTLDASEEYHSLTARLEDAQSDIESLLMELSEEDFRVAVERLQRTAAERAGKRQYESLTSDVLDTSREAIVVVDVDGTVVWANEATGRLLGLDSEAIRGRAYQSVATEQFERIESDGRSLASLVQRGLNSHADEVSAVLSVPGTAGDTERWLEYWSAPIESGEYAGGRVEHYHDITGRYTHEQHLQTLHSATRELMAAESTEVVVERTVATATADLGFPYAAVFVREDRTGDLVPAASESGGEETGPALATLSDGTGPVWTAFSRQSDGLQANTYRDNHDRDSWLDESFDDWMLAPLGQQGVFLVATNGGATLSQTRCDLAQTWAANTRQALEQLSRSRDLRDRDRKLRRQNERLSRLDRTNRLIRSISTAVAGADTRAKVESAVCRRLLRFDSVTGVWIADIDLPTDRTVCRASAGDIDGYLSDVPPAASVTDRASSPDVRPATPGRQAAESGSAVSVQDLLGLDAGTWWRDRGLKRGTHTIVAVPLLYESSSFGALEVHLDQPQGMKTEEVAALEELGATIGHAIGSVQQRNALLSGGATVLRFQIEAVTALSRLATAADVPLTVVDISTQSDGTCSAFVTLAAESGDDTDSLAAQIESATDASVLGIDEKITCVVTLEDNSPVAVFAEHGGALQQLDIRSKRGHSTLTVELPHTRDVRGYVEAVTERLDGVELVARHGQSTDQQSDSPLVTGLEAHLTDRQREVLRLAFHFGYFDWPRTASAEAVAAEVGIAQSTFSQHIRAAERNLLAALFL